MKNKELEKRISEAFRHAAPDVFDRILDSVNKLPTEESTASRDTSHNGCILNCGGVINIQEKSGAGHKVQEDHPGKKGRKKIGGIAALITAAAAAAAISFGIAARTASTAVASTISLDSGTGIEITVNKDRRVITVTPKSEDAARIVDDMDFSGADLEVTINALLGSMINKGYLSDTSDSILIGVSNPDSSQASDLQDMLVEKIDKILQSDAYTVSVSGQTVTDNITLEGAASKYGLTLSKAQLIDNITKQHPHLKFYELTALTISELNLLINDNNDDYKEHVNAPGPDDFTGSGKAFESVLAFTGLSKNETKDPDITMDYDDGRFIYIVSFESNGKKHVYKTDAATGTVLEGESG